MLWKGQLWAIIAPMPRCSVIMPTYNRAPFLERAIYSVQRQTSQDFELIIVDDGSVDGTKNLLDRATDLDSRIKVIEQSNAGPAAARNRAIETVMGNLITYIDSDNTWHPDHLITIEDELKNPYVAAYTGQNLFLVGGTVEDQKIIGRKTRSEAFNPTIFSRMNTIDIGCFAHRADILETVGVFDESRTWGEDWDLIGRIAIQFPFNIKHVDQVTGTYYAYLPEVTPTMTNTVPGWEDGIRHYFGLGPTQQVDLDAVAPLKNLIREKYPCPLE